MTTFLVLLQLTGVWVARVNSAGHVVVRSDRNLQAAMTSGPFQPHINAAGTKITYWGRSATDSFTNIYIIDEDGQNKSRLTSDDVAYESPQFSPDGTKIAYARSTDIYYMDIDGQNKTSVITTGTTARPCWVGNDSLMFTHDNFTGDGEDNLTVIHINGTGQRQITNNLDRDFKCALNPSGNRLAWHTRESPGDQDNLAVCTYTTSACTSQTLPFATPTGAEFLHGPFWRNDSTLVVHGTYLDMTNEHEIIFTTFPTAFIWRPFVVPGFTAWNHMSFSSDGSRVTFTGQRAPYATQAGTPHGTPRRAAFLH